MIFFNHRRSLLAISITIALTGCGGGGGSNPYVRPDTPSVPPTVAPRNTVPFYTPKRIGVFDPYSSPSYASYVSDIYAKDLNNDKVDEVVIGGRMTQQNDASTHLPTNLQIYGWNTGNFKNETKTWFSGTENRILGTEPAIRFGDFNGDGKVDMFVAPSTDMQIYGPASVFLNQGNRFFRQDINLGNVWGHDATVADFNGDGVSDIFVADYNQQPTLIMGSKDNTFRVYSGTRQTSGSSVSVADFLGNGTKTIVQTDAGRTGLSDTHLYSWSTTGNNLVLQEIAALPESRFYLPKWDSVRAGTTLGPHEQRSLAFDFNRDGRPDVIVFSTLPHAANNYQAVSEVQFLRNDGSGKFTDVTDSVLKNYNHYRNNTYQPQLIDVNNDGLLDIFLSTQDYSNRASTSVLVATREGVFVEQYASVFTDFQKQIKAQEGITGASEAIAIVRGPNNVNYLVSTLQFLNASNNMQNVVYLAEIGSFGTMTAQASVATLQSAWPWMSPAEANEVLSRTSSSLVDGIPVIDLLAAFNPVGGLGMAMNGRTGQRTPIYGGIFVPGMNPSLLSDVTAVDGLGRNFQVDISGMAGKLTASPIIFSQIDRPGDSWASRWASTVMWEQDGFHAMGDNMNWTTGISTRHWGWNSPYLLGISATQIQGSPWFNFNGMFGSVQSSVILDTHVTRHWNSGWWAQGGVMQTGTVFQRGLVNNVSPIYSGYGVGGWRDKEWAVQAGLQPTAFAGSMNLRLPSHVDNTGVLHYSNNRINIRNDAVYFLGLERRWKMREHNFSIHAVGNTANRFQVMARYRLEM